MLSKEENAMKYLSLSEYLKTCFGTKLYKLSLQTGCSCPNRDGTLSYGGCTFCSEGGSGDFASPLLPIGEQIQLARERVDAKLPAGIPQEERRYIAYFQSFTNTYGNAGRLLFLFQETLARPEIAILSIGTRPDCISEEMLAGLRILNQKKPVWIELGLQTIHETSAARIHRGYSLPCFTDCYRRLKEAGLSVIVHLILGLPGESEADMLESVAYLAGLSPTLDGIKLQLLHILKGTALAEEYAKKPFPLPTLEEYASLIVKCLRLLPRETVVHRITGDGPKRLLLAPLWSADKKRVLNTLSARIREA